MKQDLNSFKEILEEHGLEIFSVYDEKKHWLVDVYGEISSSSLKLIASSFKFIIYNHCRGEGFTFKLKKVI